MENDHDPFDLSGGCTIELDGMPAPCSAVSRGIDSGSIVGQLNLNGRNIGGQRSLDSLGGVIYSPGIGTGLTIKGADGSVIDAIPESFDELPFFVRATGLTPLGLQLTRIIGAISGHPPFGSGVGSQDKQQLPIGQLGPQERVKDPCESQILRNFTNIELARTGLSKLVRRKYISQHGNGFIIEFGDPFAARDYLKQNFDRLPGALGGLGTMYHRDELRRAMPGVTSKFIDYRGESDPISGRRSLQVVTYSGIAYVDTDRFNPYQDVLGILGHNVVEVLFKRGAAPIQGLCKGR